MFGISMLVIRFRGKYESVPYKPKFYGNKLTNGQNRILPFPLFSLSKLILSPSSILGVLDRTWVLKMDQSKFPEDGYDEREWVSSWAGILGMDKDGRPIASVGI